MFQSTRPVRGATATPNPSAINLIVSIHAPRTGRDNSIAVCDCLYGSFNPRAPYGARLVEGRGFGLYFLFQSTRPVRGATAWSVLSCQRISEVSIHAPRTGRDVSASSIFSTISCFNPRAPYGARLATRRGSSALMPSFNPRAPYGARPDFFDDAGGEDMFQSTRPVRGATYASCDYTVRRNVSIHAPRTGRDWLLE